VLYNKQQLEVMGNKRNRRGILQLLLRDCHLRLVLEKNLYMSW